MQCNAMKGNSIQYATYNEMSLAHHFPQLSENTILIFSTLLIPTPPPILYTIINTYTRRSGCIHFANRFLITNHFIITEQGAAFTTEEDYTEPTGLPRTTRYQY